MLELLAGVVADPAELAELAGKIAPRLGAGDLLVLTGELGAGKTTFTRALAAALGVTDQVSSPTFVIARNHATASGINMIHLDAYRLGSAGALYDLDLPYSSSITVAEWGAGLIEREFDSWLELQLVTQPDLLTDSNAVLDFSEAYASPRKYRLLGFGPKWNEAWQ